MAEQRKRQSPYQKYGKTPHRYSETYTKWKAAVKAGRHNEARDLSDEHSRKFGPAAWRRAERQQLVA